MSATNTTTNYNLSQFIGTDKPAWLTDYNGDMSRIDTAIKTAADDAAAASSTASAADGKADTNAGNITTLDTQINTPGTGLAAVVSGHTTAISSINGSLGSITGDIGAINTKIGSTPLPTTAQTLTGAINEIYSGSSGSVSVTSDGVKTVTELLDELFALVDYSKFTCRSVIEWYRTASQAYAYMPAIEISPSSYMFGYMALSRASQTSGTMTLHRFDIKSSGSEYLHWDSGTGTITDRSSTVRSAGEVFTLYY